MDRCRFLFAHCATVLVALSVGCQQTHVRDSRAALPARHSVRADNLLVLSDFKIAQDHVLLDDLNRLRQNVSETLKLPPQRDDVVVYLFSDHASYRRYLDEMYPRLPSRRAYFVGTTYELAVYTYWGDRVGEDLRHEYTHGLLHSSLGNVPLWLDEGLAEYFEVEGEVGTLHSDYATRLTKAMANGWKPNLQRLESLEDFSEMQRIDYQEAWVWVHFMLHASPDTRATLIDYVADLKSEAEPEPLSARLTRLHPHLDARFTAYLATLQTAKVLAGASESSSFNSRQLGHQSRQ